jgi:hypothetical protein
MGKSERKEKMPYIMRETKVIHATIANGEAESEALNMGEMAGGYVHFPAAWTDANLGFKVSPTEDGDYVPLLDDLGSPLQISGIVTDESLAYALPDGLYSASYFKLWSKSTTIATQTDTNQGAERSLTIVLKG